MLLQPENAWVCCKHAPSVLQACSRPCAAVVLSLRSRCAPSVLKACCLWHAPDVLPRSAYGAPNLNNWNSSICALYVLKTCSRVHSVIVVHLLLQSTSGACAEYVLPWKWSAFSACAADLLQMCCSDALYIRCSCALYVLFFGRGSEHSLINFHIFTKH